MDLGFIAKLQEARILAGIPFVITSGWRSEEYNNKLINRGYPATTTSAHLKGLAADIECVSSRARFIIITSLFSVGFARIGISNKHIHVDDDVSKAKNVIWLYGSD